jgi:uracil phosphoribosyltransferase
MLARVENAAVPDIATPPAQLTVIGHAVAASQLAILRAKTTQPEEFRRALRHISAILFAEASRDIETAEIHVETPLAKCTGAILARPIVFVPILRAGLGMLDGILPIFPNASVGHLGLYRDEETLRPVTYYNRLPVNVSAAQVFLLDPMLATGHSACEAVALLKAQGATRIRFVSVVACPVGIRELQTAHADVTIYTAAIDPALNDFGYIVPGLGDAGDRYFGTL